MWHSGVQGWGLGEEVCLDENLLLLWLDEPCERPSSFEKEHCCEDYL